jgi:hypothetical protein
MQVFYIGVIAELFIVPEGIVFFDVGWCCDPSWHPIHLIRGEISGDGPWHNGDCTIRVIDELDPPWLAVETWRRFERTDRFSGHDAAVRLKDNFMKEIEHSDS